MVLYERGRFRLPPETCVHEWQMLAKHILHDSKYVMVRCPKCGQEKVALASQPNTMRQ
jgi:predicted RNA-binding Zn-ribbon protein involved in translation (DUF1610 family)